MDDAILGMGILFQIKNQYSAEAQKIQATMGNIAGATDKMTQNVSAYLDRVKGGFFQLLAGASLLAPLKNALSLAGNFEQTRIAFETMLKSAEKAKVLLTDLQKFADFTPFEPGPVIDSAKSLLAFGFAQKEIIPQLTDIGNIASGLNIPLKELADIYGKARVQGTLFAEDINQLTGRGIPIIQEIAKQFGVTDNQVKKLVESGKVGFPHLQKAFHNLSNGSGIFAGLMDKMSQTFNGLLSTAIGYFNQVLTKIGDSLVPSMKKVIDFLGKLTKKVSDLIDTNWGKWIIGITVAVMGLIFVFGSLIPFIQTTVVVLKALALTAFQSLLAFTPYLALIGVFVLLYQSVSSFNNILDKTEKPAKGLLGLMQKIGGVIWGVSQAFASWNGKTFDLGGRETEFRALGILDTILNLATWILRLKEFGLGMGKGFVTAFQEMKRVGIDAYNGLVSGISSLMQHLGLQKMSIGSTVSNVQDWAKAGEYLAYVISFLVVNAMARLTYNTLLFATKAVVSAIMGFGEFLIASYSLATSLFTKVIPAIVASITNFVRLAFTAGTTAVKAVVSFIAQTIIMAGTMIATAIPAIISATVAFGSMAIAVLAATWPVLAIIAIVGAVVAIFYYWNDISAWFVGQWTYWTNFIGAMAVQLGDWLYDVFNGFVEWFTNIPNALYDIGVNLVNSLWEGIKSIWSDFETWFMQSLNEIPGMSYVLGFDSDALANASSSIGNLTSGLGDKMANIKALQNSSKEVYHSESNNTSLSALHLTLDLGEGQTLAKVVDLQNRLDKSRN